MPRKNSKVPDLLLLAAGVIPALTIPILLAISFVDQTPKATEELDNSRAERILIEKRAEILKAQDFALEIEGQGQNLATQASSLEMVVESHLEFDPPCQETQENLEPTRLSKNEMQNDVVSQNTNQNTRETTPPEMGLKSNRKSRLLPNSRSVTRNTKNQENVEISKKRRWWDFSIAPRPAMSKALAEKSSKAGGPKKTLLARITVYWANGGDTDSWSRRNQSATGERLADRSHAAVDPNIIPYGSKIKIKTPGATKIVKAVDTGSAVVSRKAAIKAARTPEQAKAPVIDLFFQNRSDALAYANSHPLYQTVEVY